MKVGIFTDTEWSMGKVYKDITNVLSDWEFEFINWSSWEYENVVKIFNRCDVFIVNVAALQLIRTIVYDTSKMLFISHGFEENIKRKLPPNFIYGMTSESIRPLFPSESKVFLTPNGVDESNFDYIERNGNINTIGWCGCPRVWYKQAHWAIDISNHTNIPIRITSADSCETDFYKWKPLSYDQVRKWYSEIDLLLITSIPEEKHETGPLPAFEAIVSGVVVIGTPVGNFANIPGPKFRTVEEGIDIVNELKSNPEKVKALAKEQYDYVMKTHTYKSVANKWREAIEYVSSLNNKN